MGSAKRGTAIARLSTIGTRYGNSVSTASMPPKPRSRLSLEWLAIAEKQGEKPIRNFSIDPASSIRTSIADPVFADPVSETPSFNFAIQGLSQETLPKSLWEQGWFCRGLGRAICKTRVGEASRTDSRALLMIRANHSRDSRASPS